MWNFKKHVFKTEDLTSDPLLPLFSFFFQGREPDCPDPQHHPEVNNWVDYVDENGDIVRFVVGCFGNGCQEILANSIVTVNRCDVCV